MAEPAVFSSANLTEMAKHVGIKFGRWCNSSPGADFRCEVGIQDLTPSQRSELIYAFVGDGFGVIQIARRNQIILRVEHSSALLQAKKEKANKEDAAVAASSVSRVEFNKDLLDRNPDQPTPRLLQPKRTEEDAEGKHPSPSCALCNRKEADKPVILHTCRHTFCSACINYDWYKNEKRGASECRRCTKPYYYRDIGKI